MHLVIISTGTNNEDEWGKLSQHFTDHAIGQWHIVYGSEYTLKHMSTRKMVH